MTQSNKELLLRDLCGRLQYGVKCQVQEDEYIYIGTLCRIEVDNKNGNLLDFVETISGLDCQVYLTEIKPYLFSMSSMTEEQKSEFFARFIELELKYLNGKIKHYEIAQFEIDFYNKKHLDYRGLIPKELALDATGLNIY